MRVLRPLGILSGSSARLSVAQRQAVPLAGGPLAFTLVEIITTNPGGLTTRVIVPAIGVRDHLAAHIAVRPAMGKLSFDGAIIMGIVNTTPDSFSDGGSFDDPASAIAHAKAMVIAGARIIDIGGESTRPGASAVDPHVEIGRVLPVVAGVRAMAEQAGALISIDTRNAATMAAALAAGAGMLNDVSALTHDPAALAVAAAASVPLVLMHMQGNPATMQHSPAYDDVALDIYAYFEARIAACVAAGIGKARLILDPGIGFGKTPAHNVTLLDQLSMFHGLGRPLLIGASRKGFIARLSAGEPPLQRLPGSLAAALAAIQQGAQIVRVHDVAETVQAVRVATALRDGCA